MSVEQGMRRSWAPDWATHPGTHLAEYIETKGWSQAEFARIADLTPKLISTIVSGKNPVTPDTAIKLERVSGLGAQVWLNLQTNWDLYQARAQEQARASSPSIKTWLNNFPLRELTARGVIPTSRDDKEIFESLLAFLGVGSPDAFDAKFASLAVHHRQAKSSTTSNYSIFAWLKIGEMRARQRQLPPFDLSKFQAAVKTIRTLTVERAEVFEPKMTSLCAASGVALILEPALPNASLFGSTHWIGDDRAIIQMSLRMKSNDHFWWTFFHEAAHVILHRGCTFVDESGQDGDDREQEANSWTEETLVGRERFTEFKSSRRSYSATDVQTFAKAVGIHPGIVVGMLQHARLVPFNQLNGLKAKFIWKN
ncbi:MAG: HigA family addiction module antitoxin [Rhodospirillaceae bacterium]